MSTGAELLKLLKTHEKYKGKTDYQIKKEIGGKKPAIVEQLRKEAVKLELFEASEPKKKSKKASSPEKKTSKKASTPEKKKSKKKSKKCTYKSGQQVTIVTIKTLEDERLGYEPSFYTVIPGYERGTDTKMIDKFINSIDPLVKNYLKSMQKEDPSFTKEMADKEYNSVITRRGYISTYPYHKYIYALDVHTANLF